MDNDTTKEDLVTDCMDSFKAIAKENGFGDYAPNWLNKLNKAQLERLSLFLDSAWREMQ